MSCHAGLVAPFGPSMFVPTSDERRVRGARASTSRPTANGAGRRWAWPAATRFSTPSSRARSRCCRREFADEPEAGARSSSRRWPTRAWLPRGDGQAPVRPRPRRHGQAAFRRRPRHARRRPTRLPTGAQDWRYGALARDGVSCTVCHQMQPREQPADDTRQYLEYFLETSITGNFHLGKTERALRAVRGQGDRALRDGARDGLQAEAQPLHQVVAALRHVPRGEPADRATRRRDGRRGGSSIAAEQNARVPQVSPPRRAGDLPGVAQQRVRERDQPGEPEGQVVPGLPHGARLHNDELGVAPRQDRDAHRGDPGHHVSRGREPRRARGARSPRARRRATRGTISAG